MKENIEIVKVFGNVSHIDSTIIVSTYEAVETNVLVRYKEGRFNCQFKKSEFRSIKDGRYSSNTLNQFGFGSVTYIVYVRKDDKEDGIKIVQNALKEAIERMSACLTVMEDNRKKIKVTYKEEEK